MAVCKWAIVIFKKYKIQFSPTYKNCTYFACIQYFFGIYSSVAICLDRHVVH